MFLCCVVLCCVVLCCVVLCCVVLCCVVLCCVVLCCVVLCCTEVITPLLCASGLRLLGVGRNQYIDLMNECRSSKVCLRSTS